MLHKHLQSAINLAHNHEYDDCLSYRHACVIVRGGSILSVGFNGIRKNSFVDDIVKKVGVNHGHNPTLHSEMDAIVSVRNKIDLTGAKIYIARIRPGKEVGMSAPCKLCQNALVRYGIKKAYFTISANTFGVMKL